MQKELKYTNFRKRHDQEHVALSKKKIIFAQSASWLQSMLDLSKYLQQYYDPLLLFSHSVVSKSTMPWTAACQTSLSLTIFLCFLKFMSIVGIQHQILFQEQKRKTNISWYSFMFLHFSFYLFIHFNQNDYRHQHIKIRIILIHALELTGDHTSQVIYKNNMQEYFVHWYHQTAQKLETLITS